jgi:hypothetical protein
MSSESSSEPSSSRVRSNNFSKNKSSGNTVAAFEPPIPPVVEDLRPWGAGASFYPFKIPSELPCVVHLALLFDGCQMII